MLQHRKKIELSPRLKLGVGRSYSQNKRLRAATAICLVVAIGLSLNAARIIIKGKNTLNANLNSGQAQVLGITDRKPQENQPNYTEYTIQKGDTLFNLSQKLNVNWTTIAALNNLKSPFSIKPGQILKIPK